MINYLRRLLTCGLTGFFLAFSPFTSGAANKVSTTLIVKPSIDYNKVIVKGNVKVILIQSKTQHVMIYDSQDKALISVCQRANNLYISATNEQPTEVVVYIKDLHRIDACNSASVSTKGKFICRALQVFLCDDATAFVNGHTETLYTVLKNRSKLKLKGFSKDHTLVTESIAKLNTDNFAALKTTATSLNGHILAIDDTETSLKDTVIAGNKIK